MLKTSGCFAVCAILAAGCVSEPRTSSARPLAYPPTRTVDVVEDYHGTPVADPYRWLEDTESVEVRQWAAAQRRLVEEHLAGDPVRRHVRQRLQELGQPLLDLWGEALPTRVADLEFRLAPLQPGDHDVLFADVPGQMTHILVDPSRFEGDKRLSWFRVSPDGRLVAYALSEGGSEWVQTRICDVARGRRELHDLAVGHDLPEIIDGLLLEEPVWTHDSKGFFYVRSVRPAEGDFAMFREPAVYYHVAGTPQDQDRLIHATPADTGELTLELGLSDDGRYAFIYEGARAHHGPIGWSRTRMLHLDMRSGDAPDLSSRVVALNEQRDAAYRVVATKGTTAYVFTDRDAPRRRVVAIDLENPAPGNWRDVVRQRDDVLQEVHHLGGRLVGVYLKNVIGAMRIYSLEGGELHSISLPSAGMVSELSGSGDEPVFDFAFESFLHPTEIWRHNLDTGESSLVRRAQIDFPFDQFEMKQLWHASRDGTRVPMFVLHRRGITLDGSHPTILYGYGSSGSVTTPGLWPELLVWLEMGGVFAVANPRGGGGLGVDWHEAAVLNRKQTTFDDFIAGAEFLIREGYTSPGKLAITGTSYGGLLASAVLTQRPEPFAAAIVRVPVADMLRFEPGRHVEQYGTARDPQQFPFLYAYSPLHQVKAGTCYPATLIVTSLNDERARAWHAMKLAAALQAAQACPRPILLRAETQGGHSAAVGVEDWLELTADEWAFVARHLGLARPH